MCARMQTETPPLAFECAKIVIAGSPFRPPNSRFANFNESPLSVRKFTLSTSFPRFYADCEGRRNRSDGLGRSLFRTCNPPFDGPVPHARAREYAILRTGKIDTKGGCKMARLRSGKARSRAALCAGLARIVITILSRSGRRFAADENPAAHLH